jgi:hypothetical protein
LEWRRTPVHSGAGLVEFDEREERVTDPRGSFTFDPQSARLGNQPRRLLGRDRTQARVPCRTALIGSLAYRAVTGSPGSALL